MPHFRAGLMAMGFVLGAAAAAFGQAPLEPPRSSITTSGYYSPASYGGAIRGTATDPAGIGILSVEVTVRRNSDLLYWDGAVWQAVETWIVASGTVNWSCAFAPAAGETYAVQSRATSVDARQESPPAFSTFAIDAAEPDSIVTTSGSQSSATYGGAITGTASDAASGVALVEVAVRRTDTGLYWSGTAWGAGPVWLAAAGTNAWSCAFAPENLRIYDVMSRATDRVGNLEATPGQSTFSYNLSGPDSSVLTAGWVGAGGWTGISGTAATTGGAVVTRVDISVRRVSDGRYWNGSSWGMAAQWLAAAGTVSWSYSFAPVEGVRYDVQSRATDSFGNVETTFGSGSFMYDGAAPTLTIATAGTYAEGEWSGDVQGTAVDAVSGIQKVEVAVRRSSDGLYWDGTAWVSSQVWLAAFGTGSWTRDVSGAEVGQGYVAEARASDFAGNVRVGVASSFSIVAGSGGVELGGDDPANRRSCSLSVPAAGWGAAAWVLAAALVAAGAFERGRPRP